jgi:hypothetical protein
VSDGAEFDFWHERSQKHFWPRDTPEYVFLGRAVHEIGTAIYGAEWTGSEMDPDAVPPEFKKFDRVKEEIVSACASGQLVSAFRPEAGGAIEDMPKEWWNTETWRKRFLSCRMSPKKPFADVTLPADRVSWIYLRRDSLERYLILQPFAPQSTDINVHLSPYLKVMLAVAKKMQITANDQPVKEAVIAELRAAWRGAEPLSQRLLNAMGTLLREPESGLGRARRPASKKQK